ncbi:MAG TPA: 2OG-Fe(II) oxygenase [Blastocatellia bacterium]|nr:2OG-Fe(II) oxygenase [Blastocatellia bacterium]
MPDADFFARLGLFTIKNFLSADLCEALVREARSSVHAPSLTYINGASLVDDTFRRARDARVSKQSRLMVRDRLLAIRPKLEEHFSVRLEGCEKPDFLVYNEGDFFRLHRDTGEPDDPDCPEALKRRKVSIIIFLNRHVDEYEPGCYSGGSLSLYGLIDRPLWKGYGFSLEGQPGLLIAFRSDTYHQVVPVTRGERYTIVSWFI